MEDRIVKKAKTEVVEKAIDDYILYKEDFIKDITLEDLEKEITFDQKTVKCYGKEYLEPRFTAVFGDPSVCHLKYTYSKSPRILQPMTKTLETIRNEIEKFTGIKFDFVLANYYKDGTHKVGWHSDDESSMDCSNIISLSFGAERRFDIRDKITRKKVWSKHLKNGSLVWMKKGCQEKYHHQVPQQLRITQPRINLTFRKFSEEYKKSIKK